MRRYITFDYRKTFRSWDGAYYTAEEIEFGKAMDALKRKLLRHPTDAEVLEAAKAMGYRKE